MKMETTACKIAGDRFNGDCRMTYQELLQYGRQTLHEAGIPDADLDARYLLEWVSGKSHSYILLHLNDELDEWNKTGDADGGTAAYRQAVECRSKHIPLQQITHEQIFMGYPFYVNEYVLIPRQDTEILVETALNKIKQSDGYAPAYSLERTSVKTIRILDLCCGSGCIGISLALLLHNIGYECSLTLADLSEDALKVAERNAGALDCPAEIIQGDLFENVKQTYSVIVCNPPYIRTEEIDRLMPEVKDHEPYMALDGRQDGLYYYRKIMQEIDDYIEDDGYVFFEIGFDQAEDLREIFVEHGYDEIQVQQDLAGLDRVVSARRS